MRLGHPESTIWVAEAMIRSSKNGYIRFYIELLERQSSTTATGRRFSGAAKHSSDSDPAVRQFTGHRWLLIEPLGFPNGLPKRSVSKDVCRTGEIEVRARTGNLTWI